LKSLMLLWKMLADELANACCTSATMDWKTVQGRCEHEGLSFLTITLPRFGKDLEKGLEQRAVDHDLFQGFTWRGGLPVFLRGFLDRVFDRSTGVLLDEPCVDSIRAIRQLTLMFGKMELPCTPERVNKAFTSFIQCEQDVRRSDASLTQAHRAEFGRIATMLFWNVFKHVDRKIYNYDLVPRHGPGATADRLSSNGKFRQSTWPRRLNDVFPAVEYLIPNYSFYEELEDVNILEPGAEIPVRVISVPKTMKTPRIIGIEPTAMQYMQQAIYPEFLSRIKMIRHLDKMIGFDDQTPNQRMALRGSSDGTLATLDLSEASDRVSNQHVRLLFEGHSHLLEGVDSCRSRKADVPGHGIIRLAKFSSMGSALCFPVEAMVFLTIVLIGIQRSLNTQLSVRDIKSLSDRVRVYGDDIIVPVEHVHHVIGALQDFGLVVNVDKSFWTGMFRESCGKDYYDGTDVSYIKCRQMVPTRREHVTEVISLVSLRNQLYYAGYWRTCGWLDSHLRKVIKHFPVVLPSSPVLGRHSFLGYETQKTGEHLHNPLVKGYRVSVVTPRDPLDGTGALLKYLIKPGNMPHAVGHLERAGRPYAVNMKLGWSSAV
jgi:hypothetical protein